MINKHKLILEIIKLLSREAENLANAAKVAHADATAPESKAENKYDTRGLEASYLAGAQAKMATESLQNIEAYKNIELKEFTNNSKITLTALVELQSEDWKAGFYFIGPKGGGTSVDFEGVKILLITPSSPLGSKLIGREVGDCISMNQKEYEVISVS